MFTVIAANCEKMKFKFKEDTTFGNNAMYHLPVSNIRHVLRLFDNVTLRGGSRNSGLGAWAHGERGVRACYGGLGTEPQSG